ncbi:hypothetical protein J7J47_00535 [Halomonas sp. ISL-60]|uniref:hypothetical protein n=1 Tax=Halomonas sp. ISL-56 TaxID=2819149 RepID=UPI001BEC0006|nr:hypothetical protein [Halomonas sp. ISL-56]MBT2770718.1 hypothetical protein [Halomonas sp. ISL-60]MBT2803918.1 hypothetical protein [Halomonas sp. ISL-56]
MQGDVFTLELARLIAGASGQAHDVGKAGSYFAEKLQRAANGCRVEADPVRHEWVSMKVLERMLKGASMEEALRALTASKLAEKPPLQHGLVSVADVLLYVCVTHHRLLGPSFSRTTRSLARLDATRHVTANLVNFTYPISPDKTLSDEFAQALTQALKALCANADAEERAEPYWYGLAWLSRVALILADQGVSSILMGISGDEGKRRAIPPGSSGLYANTWPKNAEAPAHGFNQPLERHLTAVAEKAGEIARNMLQMSLAGLNLEQVRSILLPGRGLSAERFAWQDEAVEAIRQRRQATSAPLLLFNVASTGAGKTVMNVKAACAAALGKPRISYALNLRTLTLQTGDALKRDLALGCESVATVIGDQVTARLHESEQTADDSQHFAGNEEDIFDDIEFKVDGGSEQLPDWLAPITDKRPEWRRILASPVLVSTVDFLVQAGEPGRQGHHAAAFLRLMHSDLILDEVDSYDTESLVAILRLIQVAAQLGRNVICSSATLPWPIAHAIAEAYQAGHRVWAECNDPKSEHGVGVLTDALSTHWLSPGANFQDFYRRTLDELSAQPAPTTKIPELQPVNRQQGFPGFIAAIETSVERLHSAHQWAFKQSDKKVSFGLVRVANIQTANEVAEALQRMPDTYVCLYHARDFVMQRHLKEKALDNLLCRKAGNQAIEQDAVIQAICKQTEACSLRFVVVATPVEEVGRDHDFDWAIIEPSGSHSIVQTAGRVNRHRRTLVSQPNIAVLQYNMRAISHQEGVVFTRPGPEGAKSFRKRPDIKDAYPDLGLLLNWQKLGQLTAGMAFDTEHPLVEGEQYLQQEVLREPLKVLRRDKGYESVWMTSLFYGKYPLRGGQDDQLEDWRVLPREGGGMQWEQLVRDGFTIRYMPKNPRRSDMRESSWLSWRIEQLWEACEEAGIVVEDGMTIKIRAAVKQR